MSVTSRGEPYAERQAEWQSDPTTGLVVTRRYFGLRTDLEALLGTGFGNGYRWNLSEAEGPTSELSIEFAGPEAATNEPIEEDWSFDSSATQAPLHELRRVAVVLATATDDEMRALRRRLESANPSDPSPSLQANPDINTLIKFSDRQVSSFYRPEPTLLYQATFQATSTYRPALAIVAAAYTRATLISTFNVPADTSSGLPPDGEWLLEALRYQRNSRGSRSYMLQWRWAVSWGRDPTNGLPWIYEIT